jgi:hypothetical protein
MSIKAGTLLWRRMRLTIAPFTTLLVDTGIRQVNKPFSSMSLDEPIMGVVPPLLAIPEFIDDSGTLAITALPVLPGSLPTSRIMVIPLPPIAPWVQVAIPTEPFFNPNTGTVNIVLANGGLLPVQLNLLVWDPHSIVGPGQADVYADMPDINNPINNPTP